MRHGACRAGLCQGLCTRPLLLGSASRLSPLQGVPKPYSAVPPGKKSVLEAALLEALVDLVDRQWSGCESLRGSEVLRGESQRWSTQTRTRGPSGQHSVCTCWSPAEFCLRPTHCRSSPWAVSPHCTARSIRTASRQSSWWLPWGAGPEGCRAGLWLLAFPPTGTLGFTEMPGHLASLEMLLTDV